MSQNISDHIAEMHSADLQTTIAVTILSILLVVSLLGHVIFFLSILKNPHNDLRNSFVSALVNLLVSNFLLCTITFPMLVLRYNISCGANEESRRNQTIFLNTLLILFFSVELLGLGVLCTERYLVHKNPQMYREWLTHRRCIIFTLVLIWFVSLLLAFLHYMLFQNFTKQENVILVSSSVNLLLLISISAVSYKVSKRVSKQLQTRDDNRREVHTKPTSNPIKRVKILTGGYSTTSAPTTPPCRRKYTAPMINGVADDISASEECVQVEVLMHGLTHPRLCTQDTMASHDRDGEAASSVNEATSVKVNAKFSEHIIGSRPRSRTTGSIDIDMVLGDVRNSREDCRQPRSSTNHHHVDDAEEESADTAQPSVKVNAKFSEQVGGRPRSRTTGSIDIDVDICGIPSSQDDCRRPRSRTTMSIQVETTTTTTTTTDNKGSKSQRRRASSFDEGADRSWFSGRDRSNTTSGRDRSNTTSGRDRSKTTTSIFKVEVITTPPPPARHRSKSELPAHSQKVSIEASVQTCTDQPGKADSAKRDPKTSKTTIEAAISRDETYISLTLSSSNSDQQVSSTIHVTDTTRHTSHVTDKTFSMTTDKSDPGDVTPRGRENIPDRKADHLVCKRDKWCHSEGPLAWRNRHSSHPDMIDIFMAGMQRLHSTSYDRTMREELNKTSTFQLLLKQIIASFILITILIVALFFHECHSPLKGVLQDVVGIVIMLSCAVKPLLCIRRLKPLRLAAKTTLRKCCCRLRSGDEYAFEGEDCRFQATDQQQQDSAYTIENRNAICL